MKTTVTYQKSGKVIPFNRRKAPVYPNAAEASYYLNKGLDYLLTVASSAGVIAALMFLFVYF